jgi:uncharacterized membrane protein YGL010W
MAAPKPSPATKAASDHVAKTFKTRIPIFASLLTWILQWVGHNKNQSDGPIALP